MNGAKVLKGMSLSKGDETKESRHLAPDHCGRSHRRLFAGHCLQPQPLAARTAGVALALCHSRPVCCATGCPCLFARPICSLFIGGINGSLRAGAHPDRAAPGGSYDPGLAVEPCSTWTMMMCARSCFCALSPTCRAAFIMSAHWSRTMRISWPILRRVCPAIRFIPSATRRGCPCSLP